MQRPRTAARIRAIQALIRRGKSAEGHGRHTQAEKFYRRSLSLLRGGEKSTLTIEVLSRLGNLYRFLGRHRAADAKLARALRIATRVFGPNALETCAVMNDRAVLFKYAGRFDEAAVLYRRVIKGMAALDEDDPARATVFHNLGGLEHARGRFARGERWARKAVELRERTLGPGHPEVAADRMALAAILERLGRRTEAEKLFTDVLRVFRRKLGPNHYDIAVTLNNLAALQQARGRFRSAQRYYRNALVMKERLLGSKHVDVALTLNNLAVLNAGRGKYKVAADLYGRALDIFRATLGPDHPKLLACQASFEQLKRKRVRKGRVVR